MVDDRTGTLGALGCVGDANISEEDSALLSSIQQGSLGTTDPLNTIYWVHD